jgi:hypothetical protein
MNSGMIRISAPSIPSKHLTPFIDYQTAEQAASNVVLQHEFCQMSKLIDDGSKVGPGSYNITGNLTDKTKFVKNWQNGASENELKITVGTNENVGPGTYTIKKIDKKP